MFEFLMGILTWIIDFFMSLFGYKKDKHVTFNEVAETSTGQVVSVTDPEEVHKETSDKSE